MIYNKKVLCIIPARGGSKGIPRKNIIEIDDKPLVAYSIECAKESRYIDSVVVSTDDEEIASISKAWGAEVPFLRPKELAHDTSKTIEAVLFTVDELQKRTCIFDILVLLQPTQPLRTAVQVDEAIRLFMEKQEDVVSLSAVSEHPVLMRKLDETTQNVKPLLSQNSTVRRQDMEKFFIVNGAIYVNGIQNLSKETSFNDNPIGYVMNESITVDIDDELDLRWARFLLNKGKSK